MIALLSIKPEFVEKIFSGDKLFEYRKSIFKRKVSKIVVYSTMPVGMIVGEFDVEDILGGTPCELWRTTKEFSGVKQKFFQEYFNGRDKGYAIKIGTKKKYIRPINPKTISDTFTPPQSFLYLNQCMTEMIEKGSIGTQKTEISGATAPKYRRLGM